MAAAKSKAGAQHFGGYDTMGHPSSEPDFIPVQFRFS
jgi:hypothetical protein